MPGIHFSSITTTKEVDTAGFFLQSDVGYAIITLLFYVN